MGTGETRQTGGEGGGGEGEQGLTFSCSLSVRVG